jgi:putative DNA primase/helicase
MFDFEKNNFENDFIDLLEKKESKDIIISTTAKLLLKYKFANVSTGVKDELWQYEDGIWKLKGKETIRSQAEIIMGDNAKINKVKEVEEKVKRLSMVSKEEFDNIPDGFICLSNGVLDLLNNKLLNHSPEYYFKTKINLFYNPEAVCPNCLNFFEDALNPEDIFLIQEWLGFQLYNKYVFKKALIIFGEKDTGKTIFLNLTTKFVGNDNCSSVPLQTINNNNRFILSSLQHKYCNIYDDLSSKDLDDVGGFKIATGGGWLSAEKKFGDAFQFKSFAKLTFACNKTPTPKDMDEVEKSAYYGRWLIIPFENQVEEKEQDKDLEKKITSKEELSGLLNWAIIGLKRLFDNNKFSFNKSWQDIEKIMLSHNNHLSNFSDACLKAMPFARVSKSDLHDYYVWWCGRRNQAPLNIKQFGKRIVKFAPLIVGKNDGERFWENYNLITDKDYKPKIVQEKVI